MPLCSKALIVSISDILQNVRKIKLLRHMFGICPQCAHFKCSLKRFFFPKAQNCQTLEKGNGIYDRNQPGVQDLQVSYWDDTYKPTRVGRGSSSITQILLYCSIDQYPASQNAKKTAKRSQGRTQNIIDLLRKQATCIGAKVFFCSFCIFCNIEVVVFNFVSYLICTEKWDS